jgi:hypothetical protein
MSFPSDSAMSVMQTKKFNHFNPDNMLFILFSVEEMKNNKPPSAAIAKAPFN